MNPLASAQSAARGPYVLQRRRHLWVGQRGLGLVELLISVAIGLFLLAGLTDFLGRSLTQSGRNFQDARLTQDLNTAMDLMMRDLRRAGYSGTAQGVTTAAGAAANAFTQVVAANDGGISLATAGCALYSYDLPASQNGTLEAAENLGFRLQGGAVQAGTGVTACNAGTWQPVTDSTLSTITALTFEYLDAAGNVANPQQPFVAATGTTWAVCTRLIRITLTGQLVGNPNVSRTLTQSVRVRNDWYRTGTTTCA
jgi:Tfp pilus assembly protein PilW